MWEALKNRKEEIAARRVVVGFDGFIDAIARPILQTQTDSAPAVYFSTIREFGEYLVARAGKSCSIELDTTARQLGGNMPFLSRGAGGLGLDVTCIGMLGEGGIEEPFRPMPCNLYSFAAAGTSTALEFQDGKVMLAPRYTLEGDPWALVMKATQNTAPKLFGEADLIALVNWSELAFSHGLWEKVLTDCVEASPIDKQKFVLFDLCDCTRKSDAEIERIAQLIGRFSQRRTAILSLNENEAHVLGARLLGGETAPLRIGDGLRSAYGIDEILIHTLHESVLCTARTQTVLPTRFVEHPKISTGAGDNFNAASCFGAVMGLCDRERVAFANDFVHFYITKGRNPSLDELS